MSKLKSGHRFYVIAQTSSARSQKDHTRQTVADCGRCSGIFLFQHPVLEPAWKENGQGLQVLLALQFLTGIYFSNLTVLLGLV